MAALGASPNRSGRGVSYLAIAAIDVAAWDLYAKTLELPLGEAMGGELRSLPAYGSAGFRPDMDQAHAIERAQAYVDQGCGAVKLRLSGTSADAQQIRAVRRGLPDHIDIAVDVTEKCDFAES